MILIPVGGEDTAGIVVEGGVYPEGGDGIVGTIVVVVVVVGGGALLGFGGLGDEEWNVGCDFVVVVVASVVIVMTGVFCERCTDGIVTVDTTITHTIRFIIRVLR